jgi:hypothetical protein
VLPQLWAAVLLPRLARLLRTEGLLALSAPRSVLLLLRPLPPRVWPEVFRTGFVCFLGLALSCPGGVGLLCQLPWAGRWRWAG